MTDKIKDIRKRFEARLIELNDTVHEIEQTLREPSNPDFAESATENEGDEVLEGLEDAASVESTQIKSALKRMELGTYGDCTNCGNPINEARLDALPYAATCIECAQNT